MNERKPLASPVSFYFTVMMLAVYLLLAVIILTQQWPADLPLTNRIILAVTLLLYVLYRGYRLMKKRRDEKQAEQE